MKADASPVTRHDLIELENRLTARISDRDERLTQRTSGLEDRLTGRMRDMQTEVLRAFHH